ILDYSFCIKKSPFKAKLKNFVNQNINAILSIKRKKNFRLFLEKHLKCTKERFHNAAELYKSAPHADIYITGSDQVWNDEILGQYDEGYLLSFVKSDSLKVSYAASIGKDIISHEYANKLRPFLESFDYISVREETAKKALENVGLNNITQVLDPVFLLDTKMYEEILTEPAIDDYVLIYCFNSNKECYDLANLLARNNKLKTISLNGWTNKFNTDYLVNTASPSEFLGYLKNARYVVTNSFHGTAFSILFEKEFYVIPPKSNSSRMESLLNAAGLQDRIITSNTTIEDMASIDYSLAKQQLSNDIELSKDFLNNLLDGSNRKKRVN
ncbi:MAG TPA: polysaccharide pyruvyl transferase family protein, partial [Clostridia bacterium]